MTIDEALKPLISTEVAGGILGITPARIGKLISLGALEARRIGQTYVMLRADVEEFATRKRPAGRPRKEAQ